MDNIFSKRTQSHINYTFKEFKNDVANDKEFRKEVSRIFSIANKRINSLDNNKLNSLAINVLHEKNIDKFSLRGLNESEVYTKYAQALSFLNNPTSLVSGAKEYIDYESEKTGLPKETINELIREQDRSADYIYNLSNKEYYGIVSGYISIEEVLQEKGFNEDVNDYLQEIEHGLSEQHTLILSQLNQMIDDIPDEINVKLF